ncbi:MAG TPA: 5-(carboxyamino)imidazole ribonucleotide synthase [Woeseiaceae bacterium]|nr:5-(carboxyamino)imidazole ribonucleotide synthase [Woeseiaceae bacterium]
MRVGIIGAGQLGQMLGFAAQRLGVTCRFLDPAEEPPAADAGEVIRRPFDDADALAELAADCDVITYEFENVPVAALLSIADRVPVFPPPEALSNAQDRLAEKRLFDELQIPLRRYRAVDSLDDLRAAVEAIGLPLVLKTRRFGYDGKGQYRVKTRDDIDDAWRALGGTALIAEEWLDFDYEVSAIGARSPGGEFVMYPLTHNEHAAGILRRSRAPVDAPALEAKARACMKAMLERLDYVGVLALELFVVGDRLLANEFAPRVHNSGHWTIEGAATSQFENHLRAVTNQPLGPTTCRGHAGMLNLIGEIPDAVRRLTIPGCWLHDYGKRAREGRKLGHITVVADSAGERDERLRQVEAALAEV